ncbi:MAG: hypothetical protein AAF361_02610 [Bacteroidota bacterium]
MISCDEAAVISNKTQYKEASFWERIKLNFHLFMCRACSAFSKKNTQLTTLCERANLRALSDNDKAQMKQRLKEVR